MKRMYKNDIEATFGNEQFLFKGSEPFTASDEGVPLGVVIADSEGRPICWECKEAFEEMGKHVRKHGLTAMQYKEKYGIGVRTPLCNKRVSRYRSVLATNQQLGVKVVGKAFKKGEKPVRKRGSVNMQVLNSDNSCPEQLKARLAMVAALTGGNPSAKETVKLDMSLVTIMERRFGSWNKAKEALGYKVNKVGVNKESRDEAVYIYALRNYVNEHGRMPWTGRNEKLGGFPYERSSYAYKFGSWKKAQEKCGIMKLGFNKYQAIG